MAGESSEDRTEPATQKRLDQAREEGQVPLSAELVTFVSLVAVILFLTYRSQALMQHLLPNLMVFLSRTGEEYMLGAGQLRMASAGLLGAVIPILCVASFAGAAAVLLQTRFLVNLGALQPKFSRVSPAAGLKRIFGSKGIVEIVKSLVKLALLAAALWIAVRADWPRWIRLPWQDPRNLLSAMAGPVFHLFLAGACVQGIVAGADFMWVRFSHARDMRMSKQSIRDESKDSDGDPLIKARIRRIRLIRARKRMMANVPTATVVITNPTHYAIALAYDRVNNPAPRIVAKGVDSLAARIRQVAQANNVPVVANPPLARALYQLEIDTEIPADHYRAVAEIITYIWGLRHSGQPVS